MPPLRSYLSVKRPPTQQLDVASLMDPADVERLVEAARFQDLKRDSGGYVTDRGTQVREQAIVALGEVGADAGNAAVIAALRDPIDSVRCAAVRVLYSREDREALGDALGWLPAGQGRSRALASRALLELRSTPAARAAARVLYGPEAMGRSQAPTSASLAH
jgi:HEAT repeat protein